MREVPINPEPPPYVGPVGVTSLEQFRQQIEEGRVWIEEHPPKRKPRSRDALGVVLLRDAAK